MDTWHNEPTDASVCKTLFEAPYCFRTISVPFHMIDAWDFTNLERARQFWIRYYFADNDKSDLCATVSLSFQQSRLCRYPATWTDNVGELERLLCQDETGRHCMTPDVVHLLTTSPLSGDTFMSVIDVSFTVALLA